MCHMNTSAKTVGIHRTTKESATGAAANSSGTSQPPKYIIRTIFCPIHGLARREGGLCAECNKRLAKENEVRNAV